MEAKPQELYSSVLSGAVVDWGSVGPGEEWVNSATHEGEQGSSEGMSHPSAGESLKKNSYSEDQNGRELIEWERGYLTAGFLDSDPLREVDEDSVSDINLNSAVMTEEEREEIQQEMAKLEEEISTLRQVLSSKEKQHADLKQKLGITPLNELRSNFSRGWQDMQTTAAFKKTSETLSTAGQKTSAAFSTLGSAISRRFEDMRSNSIGYSIKHSMSMPTMRNSPSFRSFEEKVENTVSTIKTKVGAAETRGNFEDVLSSAASASTQDTPTNNLTDSPAERPC